MPSFHPLPLTILPPLPAAKLVTVVEKCAAIFTNKLIKYAYKK